MIYRDVSIGATGARLASKRPSVYILRLVYPAAAGAKFASVGLDGEPLASGAASRASGARTNKEATEAKEFIILSS